MNIKADTMETNGSTGSDETALVAAQSVDGISILDNPVPSWWKILFIALILFAPLYILFFHSGMAGRSIYDQYDAHKGQIFEVRFNEIGVLAADRETILEYLNEKPDWLTVGRITYQANCASCHGADGGGLVGPNLTDDYWKHVRSVEGIATVIENGAGNGAMPAWKTRFSHPNQIVLTAAYVASLRRKPVPGKGPEGVQIPDWNE